MTRWYRAYEGTVTDAKLGEVALVAGCSRSVAIAVWHCILESAASVNDGGRFDATARRVAVILCEPLGVIEAAFSEMASLGMIADGAIAAWSRRQYESDSSTERSRRHRERAKEVAATVVQRCATPPETETDISPSLPSEAPAPLPQDIEPFAEAVSAYNLTAASVGWPKAQRLTPPRRAALRKRLEECGGLDGWESAMAKARASPFLTGDNDRGWRPDFDFFLQAKSFNKLMEGAYDQRDRHPRQFAAGPRRASGPGTLIAAMGDILAERADAGQAPEDPGAFRVDAGTPPGGAGGVVWLGRASRPGFG